MIRKYWIHTVLSASLLGMGLSCAKSALDIPPVNPTEADYFQTESEFGRAVLGTYAKLIDLYNFLGSQGNSLIALHFLPGDDVTLTNQNPFEHFSQLEPGNNRVTTYYQRLYQIVGRANIVLQKLDEESGVYSNATIKNSHRGEVLFLRGLSFFNLWKSYGKAPVVTQRITSTNNLTPPESSGTELIDQAVSDLSEAAGLLPDSWPEGDRGRATKNSANGFLGKALLFRANYTQNAADYTAALQALNLVTGVSLVPQFDDNFASDTENNGESIFEVQASTSGGDNVWLPNEFDGAIGTMSAYWGNFYIGNVRSNDNINFIATNKLRDAFNPADPRYPLTINPANNALIKYTRRDQNSNSGVGSVNNPRLLRFADVLLLKAEAIVQSNGSTAEAIGLINQVRTRARQMTGSAEPADYSTAESDRSTIMNWIMNERFLELAAEGHRWDDLARWHRAGIITLDNNFFDPANVAVMGFSAPKHLLLPIPRNETDRNPNITQNDGY